MEIMNDIIKKANEYLLQSDKSAIAHYIMWESLNRRQKVFGSITISCATIVGTALFASIQKSPSLEWRIIAGIVSLLAAILSALQTFLNLSERADAHKVSGLNYSGIRRTLELFILKYKTETGDDNDDAIRELTAIADNLLKLAKESPGVHGKILDRSKKRQLSQLSSIGDFDRTMENSNEKPI